MYVFTCSFIIYQNGGSLNWKQFVYEVLSESAIQLHKPTVVNFLKGKIKAVVGLYQAFHVNYRVSYML